MASLNITQVTRQEKKCDICSRCFARSEHLIRHRRTHTKEKPFTCPYCRRSFQRSDIKAVHVKKCPAAPVDQSNGDTTTEGGTRRRVRIACDNCRKRKMRCDGSPTCASCQAAGSVCHYSCSSETRAPSSQGSRQGISILGDIDPVLQNVHMPIGDTRDSSLEVANGGNIILPMPFPELNFQGVAPDDSAAQVSTDIHMPDLTSLNMPLSGENAFFNLPENDILGEFWQTPVMNSQFWFDGSELAWSAGLFDSNSPLHDHILSSSMQDLTASMQEYFDRKSRAPSPSLNKASRMWYSTPPNLVDHNKDVLRVFLGIFRRHIPETFSLFKDNTSGRQNRAAYILAMAAMGGLFCTVPGSAQVAKSLYNDARRLLLAHFNIRNDQDEVTIGNEEKLVVVKTFILLELYGLCSGDKRSYEFVEAFHGNLIHSVQEFSQASQGLGATDDRNNSYVQLLEALYILDCYRVIIMQRPASSSWQRADIFVQQSLLDTPVSHLSALIAELNDGNHNSVLQTSNTFGLASLASLSTHLWPAIYSRQNRYGADKVLIESLSLWNPSYVELACDNWLRTVGQAQEPTHLTVYHMMNIMLHANLTVLQSFAHSSPGSAVRDPKKSSIAKEIVAWAQDRNFKISCWHAENMIASIEGAFSVPSSRTEHGYHHSHHASSNPEQRRLPYEAPHVPYAVYYATLVLWCGSVIVNGVVTSSTAALAQIARGERVLSLHKVHIAQLLARVLHEVK
ncbi:hypothetical protein, variant 2 [Exophiala mesophila]|uniref:Zn(2)-C6 fungal-type domain-containing protein n=1 Tax=Exophiala mesophila TaxID=212818 RepID=A0A0D1XVV7_EXOME|nr:hypothetical protein, variant 2 [Exophiala mesophila]KIV92371.1 hypothetical protein, variant 2 [Exophiala mesophila]